MDEDDGIEEKWDVGSHPSPNGKKNLLDAGGYMPRNFIQMENWRDVRPCWWPKDIHRGKALTMLKPLPQLPSSIQSRF